MAGRARIVRDFSCGGIVWDAETNRVLLVYVENLSRKKVWTFPKGHPEKEELDEQAALREVQEETGWLCEIEKPLMDVQYSFTRGANKINKTVRWFFMRPVKKVGEPQEGEIFDTRWLDLEGAKKILTYETDLKLLKRLSQLV
jgi:8-oxo-dGTP pyrophosphatase MutT (NUDIX family)